MYKEEFFFYQEDNHHQRDLELLLHSFPSFSVDEIESAYCKSDMDIEMAADVLSGLHGYRQSVQSDCVGSMEPSHSRNSGPEHVEITRSSATSETRDTILNSSLKAESVHCVQNNFKRSNGSKTKKAPISIGMVSSILGKGYVSHATCQRESPSPTHHTVPLEKELGKNRKIGKGAESDCDESIRYNSRKHGEEFLLSMFGEGCCFETDVITDVYRNCKYDVQQAVGKLLCMSSLTFKEDHIPHSRDIDMLTAGKLKPICHSYDEEMHVLGCSESILKPAGSESSDVGDQNNHLEKEIAKTLFNMPERSEQLPKVVRMKAARKSIQVVQRRAETSPVESDLHPNEDMNIEYEVDRMSEFSALRKCTQQQWNTMKAYYEAAAEAHSKGNLDQAKYLLEQGRLYKKKADELDKQSGKFFQASVEERQPDVTLDLRDHGKRSALRLIEFHLLSLSGIPSIQFLKIMVEQSSFPDSKRSLKRFITKFLDKEHVKWHEEEGNSGIILIRLADVDRDQLSFADGTNKLQ